MNVNTRIDITVLLENKRQCVKDHIDIHFLIILSYCILKLINYCIMHASIRMYVHLHARKRTHNSDAASNNVCDVGFIMLNIM